MKRLLLFIFTLIFLFPSVFALKIVNQTKKEIIVVANYTNEKFYRVYELKPTMFNRKPILKINFGNLKEIQVYDKIPTNYKTGKKINIKQLELTNDIYKNPYKKIPGKAISTLPDSLLEISDNELVDKEYGIINAPGGKITFVEMEQSLKGA